MPHHRRRRFSTQHDVTKENGRKVENGSSMFADLNVKGEIQIQETNSSTAPDVMEFVTETDLDSASSTVSLTSSIKETDSYCSSAVKPRRTQNTDTEDHVEQSYEISLNNGKGNKSRNTRQKKGSSEYQTMHPRQHRIKIRSTKRKSTCDDITSASENSHDSNHRTVSTDVIDWDQEMETSTMLHNIESENMERLSNHSVDDNNMCRICHGGESVTVELGQLVSTCACRGTVGRVHVTCLERWLTESGKSRCELCGTRYYTQRVHRYGVPRALLMWILSQNAKQLMVDTLGIMLMSPLAVLAAWLSGRTLAGLMAQDDQPSPWPLASTFVLACMTLVCYYCWIVSAATRHALGWWIWYRSQYEVRLQCDQVEE